MNPFGYSKHRILLFCGLFLGCIWLLPKIFEISFEEKVLGSQYIDKAFDGISKAFSYLSDCQKLRKKQEKLLQKCYYYKYLLQQHSEDTQVIKRLASLMNIETYKNFDFIYANITRRELKCWWNGVWINKGKHEGIAEGLSVICAHGVVGKVKSVLQNSSCIELITSPSYRSVVHLEGDMRPILYEGPALQEWSLKVPYGKLLQIPTDLCNHSSDGLKVISSDLSGTFPNGIPYGTLSCVPQSDNDPYEYRVILFPEIQYTREVIVLRPHSTLFSQE